MDRDKFRYLKYTKAHFINLHVFVVDDGRGIGCHDVFMALQNELSLKTIYDFLVHGVVGKERKDYENKGFVIRFVRDEDVAATRYEWEEYNNVIWAANMNNDCVDGLRDLLDDHGWKCQKFWTLPNLEALKLLAQQNPVVSAPAKEGTYCRACNEFNTYAVPDGITNDCKYTCWRCASSPERVKIGLDSDYKDSSRQVMAIQRINNIRF